MTKGGASFLVYVTAVYVLSPYISMSLVLTAVCLKALQQYDLRSHSIVPAERSVTRGGASFLVYVLIDSGSVSIGRLLRTTFAAESTT